MNDYVVGMQYYEEQKRNFVLKHGNFREETSLEHNIIHKTLCFEDGSAWFEVYGKKEEIVNVEVKGVKLRTKADLFRLEFWSTDDGKSKFVYEAY